MSQSDSEYENQPKPKISKKNEKSEKKSEKGNEKEERLSKLQDSLKKFLLENRANNARPTHHSIKPSSINHRIEGPQVEKLYETICDIISEGGTHTVSEFPNEEAQPIVLSYRFRIAQSNFTDEQSKKHGIIPDNIPFEIVRFVQKLIVDVVEPNSMNDRALTAYVLRTLPFYSELNLGVNVYIIFPFAILAKSAHSNYIDSNVKKFITEEGLFKDLGLDKDDQVFENRKSTSAVPLVGYAQGKVVYELGNVFGDCRSCEDFEDAIIDPKDAFKFENTVYATNDLLSKIYALNRPFEYYLPILLAIRSYDVELEIKPTLEDIFAQSKGNRREKKVAAVAEEEKKEETSPLTVLAELLAMINKRRFEDESQCKWIGEIIYFAFNGEKAAFDTWKAAVRTATDGKYNDKFFNDAKDEFVTLHDFNTENQYTMKTLRIFAKRDSPDAYKTLETTEMSYVIDQAVLELDDFRIARFVYHVFKDTMVCVDQTAHTFYQFANGKWNRIQKAYTLQLELSTTIIEYVMAYKNALSASYKDLQSLGDRITVETKMKAASNLITKLRRSGSKGAILQQCYLLFQNDGFEKKLNDNPDLLLFKDGEIFDSNKIIFREAVPEDYCSKTMGVSRPTFIKKNDEMAREYLSKIHTNPEVRDYFISVQSLYHTGKRIQKVLFQHIGPPDGGKTMYSTIKAKLLKDYHIDLSPKMLTNDLADPSRPNPEVLAIVGVRDADYSEPKNGEMLNDASTKKLVADNTIPYRRMRDDATLQCRNQCNHNVLTNNPLPTPDFTPALIKKLIYIIWNSKFSIDAPEDRNEQFKTRHFPIEDLDPKIPYIVKGLSWIYLQRYIELRKGNFKIKTPECVKSATDKYITSVNVYRTFAKEKLDQREGAAPLVLARVYYAFSVWFRQYYPAKDIPDRDKFKAEFNRLLDVDESCERYEGYIMKPTGGQASIFNKEAAEGTSSKEHISQQRTENQRNEQRRTRSPSPPRKRVESPKRLESQNLPQTQKKNLLDMKHKSRILSDM